MAIPRVFVWSALYCNSAVKSHTAMKLIDVKRTATVLVTQHITRRSQFQFPLLIVCKFIHKANSNSNHIYTQNHKRRPSLFVILDPTTLYAKTDSRTFSKYGDRGRAGVFWNGFARTGSRYWFALMRDRLATVAPPTVKMTGRTLEVISI